MPLLLRSALLRLRRGDMAWGSVSFVDFGDFCGNGNYATRYESNSIDAKYAKITQKDTRSHIVSHGESIFVRCRVRPEPRGPQTVAEGQGVVWSVRRISGAYIMCICIRICICIIFVSIFVCICILYAYIFIYL